MMRITTFDNQTYDVSDETGSRITQAMAREQKMIVIADLGITLNASNIARIEPFGGFKPSTALTSGGVDDGFYSDEATAARRNENRAKYAPRHR